MNRLSFKLFGLATTRRRFLQALLGSIGGTSISAFGLSPQLSSREGHGAHAVRVLDNGARRILAVGPGREFKSPSVAAAAAADGDIVEIDPGTYRADASIWRAHRLLIRSRAHGVRLVADGAHAEGKAIWVIKGDATRVEGIEFHGCRVPHGNGAGIRAEGAGLLLRDCVFRENENGILGGANPDSDILIERCEFGLNGRGDGFTHNIYFGAVRSLTVRFCHLHRAFEGHCLKSRALRTLVVNNRIADEADGQSSYEAECPNGGIALFIGNLIQQGPLTRNHTLVSYGVEGLIHPSNELHMAYNTLVNERDAGGQFVYIAPGTSVARLINNIYSGRGTFIGGKAYAAGNAQLDSTEFSNALQHDYRPLPTARGLRNTVAAGNVHGMSLAPRDEYVHPRSHRPRADAAEPAAGAFSPAIAN